MRLLKNAILLGALVMLASACTSTNVDETTAPPMLDSAKQGPAANESWLLVDTRADTLSVMQGNRPVEVFRQIALGASGAAHGLGRDPAGAVLRDGDRRTQGMA